MAWTIDLSRVETVLNFYVMYFSGSVVLHEIKSKSRACTVCSLKKSCEYGTHCCTRLSYDNEVSFGLEAAA